MRHQAIPIYLDMILAHPAGTTCMLFRRRRFRPKQVVQETQNSRSAHMKNSTDMTVVGASTRRSANMSAGLMWKIVPFGVAGRFRR